MKSEIFYYPGLLLLIIHLFIPVFLFVHTCAHADDISETEAVILETAEKLFISLKERSYTTAWDLLTEKSHETIINDVYNNSKKKGVEIKKQDIIKDFNSNGLIFNRYWDGFLESFNPDNVLYKRIWEFGEIEPDKAIILLKGKAVTELEMYREKNSWKVGLVETFWKERKLKILPYIMQ